MGKPIGIARALKVKNASVDVGILVLANFRVLPPIRVLVAKPGLDGHDRGAKVVARALRDAGMEVVYTGLRQTPEQIVSAALEEDVEFIGLSILSGAHRVIVPRLMNLLHKKNMSDVQVVLGGIIPETDIESMKKHGVAAVFPPGTPIESIRKFLSENRREDRMSRCLT